MIENGTRLRLRLESVAATQRVARALAALLKPNELIILTGELGAGKTTFTQGLGAGLGVREGVISPTFVLARQHPNLNGGPELTHVDAYRITSSEEIDTLDLESSMPRSVTVVEWGRDKVEHLSDSRLEIDLLRTIAIGRGGIPSWEFSEGEDDEPRELEVRAIGPDWTAERTAALFAALQHAAETTPEDPDA